MRDYPKIVVPPPGPKAKAIVERDEAWAARAYIKEYPLVIAGGRGPMVEDVDGNRFLDFMAGIAVCSTGYNHPSRGQGGPGRGRTVPPHLRLGLLLRVDGRALRAAGPDRTGPVAEAGVPHQFRHRGHRRGDQAGPLRHPAHRDHRLPRRVPRAEHRGGVAHLEQGAPARRLRAAAAGRAPRPLRVPLPLPVLRRPRRVHPRLHRRHRGAVQPASRPARRGGHLRGAGAG